MIKKSLLILISLFILLSCSDRITSPNNNSEVPLTEEELLIKKYGIDISQKDIEIRKQIEQNLKAYFQETGSYALIFTGTPQENYDPDKNVLGRAIAFSVDELGLKNVTIDIDLRNINFINGTIVEDIFSFAIISNPGSVFFNYIFPEDKITTIGIYSFRNNNVIKEVVIPDSVTTLEEGIFYYNSSLEKVTLGKGIKTIGFNAFADCELLKEVDTSRCSSLETIGYSSFGGTAITKFTIPASVTSVEEYAFSICPNLTTIIYYGDSPDKIRHGMDIFMWSDQVTTLIVPNAINENDERWKNFLGHNFTTVKKEL